MRLFRSLLLLVCLPLSIIACRDDGLAVPGGGDMGGRGASCASHADRASCLADSACEAPSCPSCDGEPGFGGCFVKGAGPLIACPALACVKDCSIHATESSCDSDSGCTPVFADPGVCDCATAGCCMAFTRCDAAPVQCSPNGIGPLCEGGGIPEDCGPRYAPIFNGDCQIGCVRNDVCTND